MERMRVACAEKMGRFGIELLLVVYTAFTAIGFIVTYILAVHYNHVTPDLPYISDTGGKTPESCIFTFILSVSAMFVLVIVYIRFKHIHQYYRDTVTRIHYLNILALVVGLLSALGMLMVGSFQNDVIPIPHFIGAVLTFSCGMLYSWLQTYISFRIYHASLTRHISSVVIVIRFILSVLSVVLFVTVVVSAVIASMNHHENLDGKGTFHWKPEDGGFAAHVVSTASEWLIAGTFALFFLTFHPDFMKISLDTNIRLRYQYTGDISESTPLTI